MKLVLIFLLWNIFIIYLVCTKIDSQTQFYLEQSRIIGGVSCRAGQFPFAAAINITTPSRSAFCGGSLINPQWILTAAYCVENATTIVITLGTISLLDNSNPSTQIVSTATYFLHPEFSRDTLENDIALVKLRQKIEYNDYIGKIHLPVTDYSADVNVTAIGWGQTTVSNINTNLNCVGLITISNLECRIFYGSTITDNMICVSGQYDEGICTGDSGSPLVYLLDLKHPIIVGIASFHSGLGCESVEPSGFTRTFPYREWILNITGPLT